MLARRLLGLSPIAIVASYATITALAKLADTIWIYVPALCSLVWGFALYLVAQNVANERAGIGRITFPIAIILTAAAATVPQVYGAIQGDPLYYLEPASVALVVMSIGLAVSALLRSEHRSDWVFTWSSIFAILAILFLPLGVWFLQPRVADLLRR